MKLFSGRLICYMGIVLALAVFPVKADEEFSTSSFGEISQSTVNELDTDIYVPPLSSSTTVDTGNVRLNTNSRHRPLPRHRTREQRYPVTRGTTTNYNCTTQSNDGVTQTSCISVEPPVDPTETIHQQKVKTDCGNTSVRQTTRIRGDGKVVNQSSVSNNVDCR